MIHPKYIWRMLQINRVLYRHGLDEIVFAAHLFRPLRYLYYLLPWNIFRRRKTLPRGVRIRKTLEDLGPIFVKFGQILSTRRDLLPEDIADELAKLQDKVPPFPTADARWLIERAYGKKIEDVFDAFDDTPLASASIAQVYAATLKNGAEVVVKVVRPDILPVIRHDLGLLKQIAEMAERYSAEARRLRPKEVVIDYKKTILDELDLRREAANASQLRRAFQGSGIFYVPEVHWDWVRSDILVMERIKGIAISDVAQLHARGVNMKRLAERGVEIFFTQVFVHNFFHADMHPGNIFVNADDPENPSYIGIDFGIVGTLSEQDRRYLAENFLAFFNRDYRRVAQLHIDSGWAPNNVSVQEFESAIRTVCEPVFEKPLKEISFGRFLVTLFQTARRFNLQIQPQLVLLQKTLLNIEGLGRQLYPELDLWTTAKPFLEKAMHKETCMKMLLDRLPVDVPDWVYKMPAIPAQLLDLLQKATDGRLPLSGPSEYWRKLEKRLAKNSRRHFFVNLGTGLLLGAAILFGLNGEQAARFAGMPLPTWLLGIPGLLLLLLAWPDKE